MANLALEGIRVIDCTISMAGPIAGQILGYMGAEVIKVESIQRLDVFRAINLLRPREDGWWERAASFSAVNRNKLSITLNLTDSRAVQLFKRLVKIGDIVLESYTPRVMANFGLDYKALQEVNPSIIMVSMSSYGRSGSWRDYTGFAISVEQAAGVPMLLGYPDGGPLTQGLGLSMPDPVAGFHGAFAALSALRWRRRTGQGQHIDLAQNETMGCLIGDAIMDYTMNRRIQGRRGNRHTVMAPHGCYRCSGQDKFVAIAVSSDDEWQSFCQAIGEPAWCKDERFSSTMGRLQNQDELDRLVEEWTICHGDYEVMHLLQRVAVAAGAVLSPAALLEDQNLQERGFWQWIDRAEVGSHPYSSVLPRMSRTPGPVRMPWPTLGQHNDYVLRELLGVEPEEVAQLTEEKIIGTRPIGV